MEANLLGTRPVSLASQRLALVAGLFLLSGCGTSSTLEFYGYEPGNFRILVAGKPEHTQKIVSSAAGQLAMNTMETAEEDPRGRAASADFSGFFRPGPRGFRSTPRPLDLSIAAGPGPTPACFTALKSRTPGCFAALKSRTPGCRSRTNRSGETRSAARARWLCLASSFTRAAVASRRAIKLSPTMAWSNPPKWAQIPRNRPRWLFRGTEG